MTMRGPVPILMYHSVDSDCAPAYRRWVVSPARFEEQMAALKAAGKAPITVSELARQMQAGSVAANAVAITFDDGLADFRRGALPVLERFGFASTLFVATGYVGATSRWLDDLGEGDRPMLGWDEIGELSKRNVEIGAHTHSHPQLDLLKREHADREITLSKTLLEDHIGRPVRSFAYPHGYSTPTVRELVARAGFGAACRVSDGLSPSGESLFALSRLVVTEDWSAAKMAAVLDGNAPIAPPPDRPSMRAWRLVRRTRALLGRRNASVGFGGYDGALSGTEKHGT